jgi:hypothetical protein
LRRSHSVHETNEKEKTKMTRPKISRMPIDMDDGAIVVSFEPSNDSFVRETK